jgi:hypothetical protein
MEFWVIGIFIVVCILVGAIHPLLGWLTFFSVVGGCLYLMFRQDPAERKRDREQKKLKREEKAKQDAEAARRLVEMDELAQEWRNAPALPTTDQLADLIERYAPPLNQDLLRSVLDLQWRALSSVTVDKLTLRPAQAQALYQQLIKACIEGIRGFASELPAKLTTHQPPVSVFAETIILTTDDLLAPAWALVKPFDAKPELRQLFDEAKIKPYDPFDRIIYRDWDDTPEGKREYQQAFKAAEKREEQLRKDMHPIDMRLGGTPYFPYASCLYSVEITAPFAINEAARFAGTWIVAPPGRGKTNLLHNMIQEDLKERCTIVLMDSKGDLINGYKGFNDVVVIDPATANINPLQLGSSTRSVEFLEYIFGALLETSMTPLQKTLFRSVLTVLIKVPNATLETFRQILTVGWKPLDLEEYILQCDPSTQDFFLTGKPPEFDNATYRETKQQILWRLRLILSNDYLRNIFTSPTTNVQFSELLDSGATIIIDNSKDDLGEEGAEFFGRFFVALTWMAAVTRSRLRPEQKMPVYFYIDECQSVIKRDEKIATILDECRSQKIALILAHQRVAQIVTPNVLDALGNCAIRIANSDEDAPSLASRFRVESGALRLPVGSFACFVRDKTPQAVTVSVPEFDLSTLPEPPPRNYHAPPPPPRPKPREEVPAQPAPGTPKAPLDFG